MVKSVPTICYEIQAEARKMAADLEASSLTLRVHPEIAKALKTREAFTSTTATTARGVRGARRQHPS